MEPETEHHAMVNCTKARSLRERLREEWALPDDHTLRYTGRNWVLVLLGNSDEKMISELLFLWRRTWHLRNNIIFGDGKCRINQSAIFLESYLATMFDTRSSEMQADPRRKQPVVQVWKRPTSGWPN
jgi:hypothetical protein